MLKTFFSLLLCKGMSWKIETGEPSFSTYMRWSKVLGAAILRRVNWEVILDCDARCSDATKGLMGEGRIEG